MSESRKGGMDAADFIGKLFREGYLNQQEFENRRKPSQILNKVY